MKAHDAAYYRFWTVTSGMGPAERRVIEEHNALSEADQAGEEAAWFTAWFDAVLQDCGVKIEPPNTASGTTP